MEIKLKTESKFFKEIWDGKKNFEIRLGDKKIKEGDVLLLLEKKNNKLTGRELRKEVKFVLKTKDLLYWKDKEINKYGFVVVGF